MLRSFGGSLASNSKKSEQRATGIRNSLPRFFDPLNDFFPMLHQKNDPHDEQRDTSDDKSDRPDTGVHCSSPRRRRDRTNNSGNGQHSFRDRHNPIPYRHGLRLNRVSVHGNSDRNDCNE